MVGGIDMYFWLSCEKDLIFLKSDWEYSFKNYG